MIGAGSVVMLLTWEACEPLTDFRMPLAVESLTAPEAAEMTALLGLPEADTSGSSIGDEPITSPLLFDERR